MGTGVRDMDKLNEIGPITYNDKQSGVARQVKLGDKYVSFMIPKYNNLVNGGECHSIQ